MRTNPLDEVNPVIQVIGSVSKVQPEAFLLPQLELATNIGSCLKLLFDYGRMLDKKNIGSGLDELCVQGFDTEQIWAMLQMENQPILAYLEKTLRNLDDGEVYLINNSEEESVIGSSSLDSESDEKDSEEDNESQLEDNELDVKGSELDGEESEVDVEEEDTDDEMEATEVDDDFLKLREMDKFTEMVEQEDLVLQGEIEEIKAIALKSKNPSQTDYSDDDDEEESGDEDSVYDDKDEEEQGGTYTYEDFFGSKSKITSKKPSTSHQRRQQELHEQIAQLEDEAIADKPWRLKGETSAKERPTNALLEEGDLDVEFLSKPAPAITEEATMSLEDTIKSRILNSDFDDVERKLASAIAADYRPKLELSMEKSKVGLGEEYAKDYEEKIMGSTPLLDKKRSEAQDELHNMFSDLCHKLDALSNYNYTPKNARREDGAIRPLNVSAIQMEEVIPASMSGASQAAPEQILAKKSGKEGVGKSREELDQAERNRLRQDKKTQKRKEKRMRDIERGVIDKFDPSIKKTKTMENNSDVKWTKSADFFKQMQANSTVDAEPGTAKKKKVEFASNLGASYRL